jgi:hypothetical protein
LAQLHRVGKERILVNISDLVLNEFSNAISKGKRQNPAPIIRMRSKRPFRAVNFWTGKPRFPAV